MEGGKKRIGIVSEFTPRHYSGGTEHRNWELAGYLAGRGFEVDYICFNQEKDENPLDNVTIMGVADMGEFVGRRGIFDTLRFAFGLSMHLSKRRYDLLDVVAFPPISSFFALMISKVFRTPCVLSWHMWWGDFWVKYLGVIGYIGVFLDSQIRRMADLNICVSHQIKNRVGGDRCVVIPNWVDLDFIKRIPGFDGAFDVVYVGRLVGGKEPKALFDALELTSRRLRVAVVGGGPLRGGYELRASKMGHEVTFFGQVGRESVISILKSSKMLVNCSETEGFGISVLEAFASKKPAIILFSPGNSAVELIREGVNGYVVYTLLDLASKMTDVSSDDELRNRLSNGAYESAKEYGPDKSFEVIVDEYSKLFKT